MDEEPRGVSGRSIRFDFEFNRDADSMLAEAYRRLLDSTSRTSGASSVQIAAELLLPAKEEAA